MTKIQNYAELDRNKLDALYFKATEKIRNLENKEAQIQKQKENIQAQRAMILKAINADEGFIRLEDTDEYKEYQNLDPNIKQELIKSVEADMELITLH